MSGRIVKEPVRSKIDLVNLKKYLRVMHLYFFLNLVTELIFLTSFILFTVLKGYLHIFSF